MVGSFSAALKTNVKTKVVNLLKYVKDKANDCAAPYCFLELANDVVVQVKRNLAVWS